MAAARERPADPKEPATPQPKPLAQLVVVPNPIRGYSTARFQLSARSEVTILLSDLTGAPVHAEAWGSLDAGEHVWSLPVQDLGPGIYFLTLVGDHGDGTRDILRQKLAVIR